MRVVYLCVQTVGSLETLLLQLGNTAAGIVNRVNGAATVSKALGQLQDMKLVFDSQTRQMLLKKAVTALTNLNATLSKLGAQTGGQFNSGGSSAVGSAPSAGGASSAAPRQQPSSSAGLSGMALLNSPMPTIERATVVFDPANMRTGTAVNPDGMNRNIKPTNKVR
jgi:hypothetical protein